MCASSAVLAMEIILSPLKSLHALTLLLCRVEVYTQLLKAFAYTVIPRLFIRLDVQYEYSCVQYIRL